MQTEPTPDDLLAANWPAAPLKSDSPGVAPAPAAVDGLPPARARGGTGATDAMSASLALYSTTIFASAFLLFQIQPLIGKFILPWFGGTPGVWTTCMLVFQLLLFGGYLYAHLTVSLLKPTAQAILHVVLLTAACLALPIVPNYSWKPTGDMEPISRIVLLLGATVGLPFFVLSATGPLLQGWFSRSNPGRSPYRLYALSNAGSLLALVSFPAVFDWTFATRTLTYLWSGSFVLFSLLCAACGVSLLRQSRLAAPLGEAIALGGPASGGPASGWGLPAATASTRPAFGVHLLWFLLAMVPSVLLLATTNQVCLDVASVPFLWVLPLTLYLLSFILCFDSDWWYSRRMMMPAVIVAFACLFPVMNKGATAPFALQLIAYFTAFFMCAMVCHGELVRRKPDAAHLTSFYLVIAAGGAAGGIFVGIVSPLVFKNYYELQLGLFACAALMLVVIGTDQQSRFYNWGRFPFWLIFLAALGLFGFALIKQAAETDGSIVDQRRTFYGVLRVARSETDYGEDEESILRLVNGRIAHGFQYEAPKLRSVATTYYGPETGIGILLTQPSGRPRRVGLVGLGIGTLATYGRPGDTFRFYEINPMVEHLARKYFHYLADSRAKVDVVHGDARLTLDRQLERHEPQNFDVLALDAFSGDAIPVHLLTVEAFQIYLRHLAPRGVIAVHISNRHFDLEPVVDALAAHDHLATACIHSDDTNLGGYASEWILVSRDPSVFQAGPIRDATRADSDRRVLWTDDYAPLVQVLWRTSFERLWENTREWFSDVRDELFGTAKKEKDEAPE